MKTKITKNLLTVSAIFSVMGCGSGNESDQNDVKHFDFPKNKGEIINGNPAEHSSFPSIVAMIDNEGSEWCSGTLIKPDFVITAAHCIPYNAKNRKIVYGVSDVYEPCDECVHEIAQVKANQEYFPFKNYGLNDIGWLLLKEPITNAVTAEVLPEELFDVALHTGDIVQIAGYGNDSYGSYGYLNSANVPIIDFLTADGSVNGFFEGKPGKGYSLLEMVVGLDDVTAPNLCYGDSGGPTYVEYNGSIFLTGVTSRVPPGKEVECGHGAVVGLPGHYQDLTEKVYLELKNSAIGEGGSGGSDGSGGNSGSGNGGSGNVGDGSAETSSYADEPIVMLDRPSCSYSNNGYSHNKNNNNMEYGLLLGMAGLLGFRRRRD